MCGIKAAAILLDEHCGLVRRCRRQRRSVAVVVDTRSSIPDDDSDDDDDGGIEDEPKSSDINLTRKGKHGQRNPYSLESKRSDVNLARKGRHGAQLNPDEWCPRTAEQGRRTAVTHETRRARFTGSVRSKTFYRLRIRTIDAHARRGCIVTVELGHPLGDVIPSTLMFRYCFRRNRPIPQRSQLRTKSTLESKRSDVNLARKSKNTESNTPRNSSARELAVSQTQVVTLLYAFLVDSWNIKFPLLYWLLHFSKGIKR
ncbi:hypothetical protein Y032_0717g1789 [Ancylostoma ceylanicum]|uniref:Uncharacterized protein n=2 Tax=Ancylostoma ceylanicum TaxID=53326 RepID=A0A016WGL8_9BILA|nr:hypothetical protein Y032_0717g1789 [Ancylostoma ceylanicum]